MTKKECQDLIDKYDKQARKTRIEVLNEMITKVAKLTFRRGSKKGGK